MSISALNCPSAKSSLIRNLLVAASLLLPSITQGGENAYVDQLIDPSQTEDSYFQQHLIPAESSRGGSVRHSLQAISFYRKSEPGGDKSLSSGISYAASTNTGNYGRIDFSLIALNEDKASAIVESGQQTADQSSLRRLTLRQTDLPVTERLSMDNIIGAHRQTRRHAFRERPNLIDYRFGAAEPDVFGVSSRLNYKQTSLLISHGELGESAGSVLPGFAEKDGELSRLQLNHQFTRHAIDVDAWNSSGQTLVDDRQGFRLAYTGRWSEHTVASGNIASSGNRLAVLAGGSTHNMLGRHDYGAYYFEPDFIWMDTRIGDNSAGVFYRHARQLATAQIGASLEYRQDGLDSRAEDRQTSSLLNLNIAKRLNRRSSLSTTYSMRRIDYRQSAESIGSEHNLRSYFTHTHGEAQQSNIGGWLRHGDDMDQIGLSYALARNFQDDSRAELNLQYQRTSNGAQTASEFSVGADWNSQFLSGRFLSVGLGYAVNRDADRDGQGLNAHMSYEHSINEQLGVSLQLDYSRNRIESERLDFSDTLFTDREFVDEEFEGYKELTAMLSVRYQFGAQRSPTILSARGARAGSGSVRGYVFLDSNGDGQRQAGEQGVEGITVFLNSVHPVLTNSRGEYRFPTVGLGEHFLFVDESTLPLPWTLRQGEFNKFSVNLRRVTQVDIPVAPFTMAETEP